MSEQTNNTDIEEKGKKLEDIRKEAEEKACPVQMALYFINEFLSGPMCGKCFPCSIGTQEAKIRLIRIAQHLDNATVSDIDALKRIAEVMIESSRCKKGKDTGRFITELLNKSHDEFASHLDSPCAKKECIFRTEYIINPDLCIKCGKCLEACKYNAIIGNVNTSHIPHSFPFEIRQEKCTRCGECVNVCPTEAIDMNMIEIEEPVSTPQQL
jgi:NAD-dependent dihydropyrimidine dehydrogenase PreA subunit